MRFHVRIWSIPFVMGLGLVCLHAFPWTSDAVHPSRPRTFAVTASPQVHAANLIGQHCAGCHTSGRAKIDFDGPIDRGELRRERATWESALHQLQSGQMPPPKFPQPVDDEREFLIHWLEEQLASLEPADTMHFRVRRMRQVAYRNTIRDLFNVAWQPAEDFPADDSGWDLAVDVPTVPAELVPHYEAAAASVLAMIDVDSMRTSLALETRSEAELARTLVATCARQAYGRPLTAADIHELNTAIADAAERGLTLEQRVKAGLKLVLTSPHFLYRIEPRFDPDHVAETVPSADAVLAARLAHFLWSSAPDEELLVLAQRQVLRQNLADQTRRMLKDARARALVDDFAMTWLGLRDFKTAPKLDVALVNAMRQETELFVEHIVQEDRSVLEFLDADYTFLNGALARHYGISGVQGEHMRRVSVAGTARGGLLTQASILTTTSYKETSPVQRGKWVLTNLLGTPPPPPPSGLLEAFSQPPSSRRTKSAKEALALHSANASCAHCHAKIDSLGTPLENFDPAGRWRTEYLGRPVDPTALMPDGKAVDGPLELKAYLLGKQEQFVRCLASKLLKHALGRKLTESDGPALDTIIRHVAENQFRFSTLVLEVVQSTSFQKAWNETGE
jgi:mono/diheme cytochrome c family protein